MGGGSTGLRFRGQEDLGVGEQEELGVAGGEHSWECPAQAPCVWCGAHRVVVEAGGVGIDGQKLK